MRSVIKSIFIVHDSDYSIIKHHIKSLDLLIDCEFKEGNIIDFYDDYLYQIIKSFLKHTKIKSKINKIR
jgi:hypothetical protein